jgi:hypothetical protein
MDTIDTNKTAFANENIPRMDLESDIRLASRMLGGSSINELRVWRPDSGDLNLTLYCYLSQLLSVGGRGIAVTGTMAFDSVLGRVRARMIVASTNSHKCENIEGKDTNLE